MDTFEWKGIKLKQVHSEEASKEFIPWLIKTSNYESISGLEKDEEKNCFFRLVVDNDVNLTNENIIDIAKTIEFPESSKNACILEPKLNNAAEKQHKEEGLVFVWSPSQGDEIHINANSLSKCPKIGEKYLGELHVFRLASKFEERNPEPGNEQNNDIFFDFEEFLNRRKKENSKKSFFGWHTQTAVGANNEKKLKKLIKKKKKQKNDLKI